MTSMPTSCTSPAVKASQRAFRNGADTVILATGWHTDYGFLPDSIRQRIGFEDDGYYLYRQVFHPDVPNLAFLVGFEVWFAAFTADPTTLIDRVVTNWVRVTLGP